MPVTLINPDGLPKVELYRQVAIATGTKMVFIAGQVSVNADGETVGKNDLATQVEQCYLNVATALAGAGATFNDVVKLTLYVVNLNPEIMPLLLKASNALAQN
jgi:enamine deaminase RidA (YjgF/YER057c/UK114 family)